MNEHKMKPLMEIYENPDGIVTKITRKYNLDSHEYNEVIHYPVGRIKHNHQVILDIIDMIKLRHKSALPVDYFMKQIEDRVNKAEYSYALYNFSKSYGEISKKRIIIYDEMLLVMKKVCELFKNDKLKMYIAVKLVITHMERLVDGCELPLYYKSYERLEHKIKALCVYYNICYFDAKDDKPFYQFIRYCTTRESDADILETHVRHEIKNFGKAYYIQGLVIQEIYHACDAASLTLGLKSTDINVCLNRT